MSSQQELAKWYLKQKQQQEDTRKFDIVILKDDIIECRSVWKGIEGLERATRLKEREQLGYSDSRVAILLEGTYKLGDIYE